MKIKLWLVLIFLISHNFILCQTVSVNGVLMNSMNNVVIPSATILNNTTGKFILSDSIGRFSLQISKKDSITISHIGYNSLTIKIDTNLNNIYLTAKKILLDEVTVVVRKASISREHFGYDLIKGKNRLDLQKYYRHAVYFQNNQKIKGIIKKINFNIHKKGKCYNGVRILIFNVDSLDIKKSIVLLSKPIELPYKKIGYKNKIDVSLDSIQFPLNGVIVSIESFDWQESCQPNNMMQIKSTENITEVVNLIGFGNNIWELMEYPNWRYTPEIGIIVEFKK